MEFKVPQYIEVEDKVFGPFTIMQFVYLLGGGGLIFLLWSFLPHFIAILLILPVGAFTWALAFFPKKRYGKSFPDLAESAVKYFSHAKLYTWKKLDKKPSETSSLTVRKTSVTPPGLALPNVSESKLKDLSWNLDVSKGTSNVEDNK